MPKLLKLRPDPLRAKTVRKTMWKLWNFVMARLDRAIH
jgi:hypothetical protein